MGSGGKENELSCIKYQASRAFDVCVEFFEDVVEEPGGCGIGLAAEEEAERYGWE